VTCSAELLQRVADDFLLADSHPLEAHLLGAFCQQGSEPYFR